MQLTKIAKIYAAFKLTRNCEVQRVQAKNTFSIDNSKHSTCFFRVVNDLHL